MFGAVFLHRHCGMPGTRLPKPIFEALLIAHHMQRPVTCHKCAVNAKGDFGHTLQMNLDMFLWISVVLRYPHLCHVYLNIALQANLQLHSMCDLGKGKPTCFDQPPQGHGNS